MGRNLTNLFISESYEFLTQISGSELQDGLGNDITFLAITASQADNATSASFASTSVSSSFAQNATSASYALNADNAISSSFASNATSASFADNATSASFAQTAAFALNVDTGSLLVTASISDADITFTKGDASTFSITVNNVSNADSASLAANATNAVSSSHALFADNAGAASTATSASHALNADNAISASFAQTAAFAQNVDTGSVLITASISDATITFTKGDASTFNITVDNVSNADSASVAISASHALNSDNAVSASFATTALFATSASHTINADTASFLPSTTNLNITNITASGGNFVNLTAVSASFGHVTTVTGSAVIIGDEFIILNADTPTARYAGLIVFDSGSGTPETASFEWDGETDNWIIMEETGNTAVVLTGPTGSRGAEVLPTTNRLQKGGGHHQLIDSSITDDGTLVSISTPLVVTGSINATSFTGS
jgi:hypothetical protein